MKILVVGAGIAGLTTALLLRRGGTEVDIVEHAPGPREEGYFVNLHGRAVRVARSLGIEEALISANCPVAYSSTLKPDGRLAKRMDIVEFSDPRREALFLPRPHLQAALTEAAAGGGEIRYGTEVTRLDPTGESHVIAGFGDGAEARYDFVIGADGVRSQVRALAGLGSPSDDLNAEFLAFELEKPLPAATGSYTLVGVGRSVTVVNIADSFCAGIFWLRRAADDAGETLTPAALPELFGEFGWHVPEIIASLPNAKSLFGDRALQVAAQRWHAGRIALVGDSAFSVSPLAAKGATLAMVGADILSAALLRHQTPDTALDDFRSSLAAVAERGRLDALRNSNFLLPRSEKERDGMLTFVRFMPGFLLRRLARAAIRDLA